MNKSEIMKLNKKNNSKILQENMQIYYKNKEKEEVMTSG